MPEYIERESTIKELHKAPACFDSGDIRYGILVAINQVEKQPTADVVEVKQGEWIANIFVDECNLCGYSIELPYWMNIDELRYCPNCGAKMGVKDDR